MSLPVNLQSLTGLNEILVSIHIYPPMAEANKYVAGGITCTAGVIKLGWSLPCLAWGND